MGAGPFVYDGTTHDGGSGTVTGAGMITGSATPDLHGRPGQRGHLLGDGHYAGDANHFGNGGAATITMASHYDAVTVVPGTFTYDGTTHTGGSQGHW